MAKKHTHKQAQNGQNANKQANTLWPKRKPAHKDIEQVITWTKHTQISKHTMAKMHTNKQTHYDQNANKHVRSFYLPIPACSVPDIRLMNQFPPGVVLRFQLAFFSLLSSLLRFGSIRSTLQNDIGKWILHRLNWIWPKITKTCSRYKLYRTHVEE